MPTTLTFAVGVNDGQLSASDSVDILVNPVGGSSSSSSSSTSSSSGGGAGGAGGGGMGGIGGSSSSSSSSSSSTASSSTGGGVGGEGGEAGAGGQMDAPIVQGGCDCSVPGSETPTPVRDVGSSFLAIVGAWLIGRRRNNKRSLSRS